MDYAFSSPLKAVQGTAIQDLTYGQFGPPKFGRSRTSRTPREWPTSLSHSSSTLSSRPPIQVLSHVFISAKPLYVPNKGPPPQVHGSLPDDANGQNKNSRKVIINRFLLADGHISFAVRTEKDGIITRDAEEIPVAKILDIVSPAELERYENQDFYEEDERERLLPPPKPRGRPRKGDKIVPTLNIAPIGEAPPSEQSQGSIQIKRRAGRPKGALNKKGRTTPDRLGPLKKANNLTLSKPSVLLGLSPVIKRPRGRPPRQKNLAVVVPSFNGPQPQELENTTGAESDSDDMLAAKPQYSMIAASGLGQSDTEDMTSRDQSVELVPSSKRRRLENDDELLPHSTKRAKMLPETSPDPIADDSAALLRQFQANVYGPNHTAKSSNIPHRQSKPSPTLDDHTALLKQFQGHTRSSSSSSDSLMGPTSRPLKPVQTQPSNPYFNNNIIASHQLQRQPEKDTPAKPIPRYNSTQRKVSLTPHYPPRKSFSHDSMDGSANGRPPSSLSSTSRPAPSQPINTAPSQPSRIIPSPPKKTRPSPKPQSAPPQLSTACSTSKLGFAGIPPAKAITDYFTPKAPAAKPAPAPTPTPHSPSLQLLVPNDSESEDQLARAASGDSIGSEVIIVQSRSASSANRATTAEARTPAPSNAHHVRRDRDSSSSDDASSDSSAYSSHDHEGPTLASNTVAPIPSLINPSLNQLRRNNAEALINAFEIEDNDDGGESDSESSSQSSDSSGSEVMIVRPG